MQTEPTPGEIAVTWVGHSTVLIEMDGGAVLTDPNFSLRIKGLPRLDRPGLSIDDLPLLDAVLVSHAHLDHCDVPSLRRLYSPLFVTAPRVGAVFHRHVRGEVRELAPGEETSAGPFRIRAIPVRHPFTARWGFDIFRGAVGFSIAGRSGKVLFLGDTAYTPEIAKSVEGEAIDLALVPVGAFWPRFVFGRYHLDPEQAIRVFEESGARLMLPIHWGAFRLSLERVGTPARITRELARRRGLKERILFPARGERLLL